MRLSPDGLISLGDTLRRNGFKIGPAHHLDAQRLLDTLRRAGIDCNDDEQLAAYLAPIYCANADQQARFTALLQVARGSAAAAAEPVPAEVAPVKATAWPRRLVAILIAALLLTAIVVGIDLLLPRSLEGVVLKDRQAVRGARVSATSHEALVQEKVSGADGRFTLTLRKLELPALVTANMPGHTSVTQRIEKLEGARLELVLAELPPGPGPKLRDLPPEFERVYAVAPQPAAQPHFESRPAPPRFIWQNLALAATPALLALCWWLYWFVRRQAWLGRLPDQTPKNVRHLSSGARRSLSLVLGTGRAGHELRRRVWVSSPELNVEATLLTMVQGTGAPRLVFGSRVEPEYLALIDETSQVDHLARLADELMLSLEVRDVALKRFFFRESPLLCDGPAPERQPRPPGLPLIALDELLGRHPQHRLIIVSDGRPFFDVVTGQALSWLPQLLQARDCVFMTPTVPERWGRREWALSRQGFTVLPLTPEGLLVLGELHGSDKPVAAPASATARAGAPRWIREPLSVLLPTPPRGVTAPQLASELRAHLGERAYLWLQAAAVYPEIHWGMTLRIGAALLPERELAQALPQLVRLPWFRDSYMPMWLRGQLAGSLAEAQWTQVHAAILGILDAARTDDGGEIPLRIAAPPKVSWWSALRQSLRRGAGTRHNRLHRDAVFLRFMQGPAKVSVLAVERIKCLFFREGLWSLGVRGLPLLAMAGIAGVLVAWQWPFVVSDPRLIEVPAPRPPHITALAMTGNAQSPVMAGYDNGEVWQIRDGASARLPITHSAGVADFMLNEPGRLIVALSSGRTVVHTMNGVPPAWRAHELRGPMQPEDIVVRPDLDSPAFVRRDGSRVALGGSEGMRTHAARSDGKVLCAAVAPAAGALTVVYSTSIETFDYRRGSAGRIDKKTSGCIADAASEYIFGWDDEPATGRTIWRFNLSSRRLESPSALTDGPPIAESRVARKGRVLGVLRGGQVELYDGMSGEARGSVSSATEHFALSEDGTSLALAAPDGAVEVWRIKFRPPVLDQLYVNARNKIEARIYFDYDKYSLREESRATLDRLAGDLKGKLILKILIAGHTSQDSSREYALVLTQRMAEAARNYLVATGLPARSIETVSFGYEQPLVRTDCSGYEGRQLSACLQPNRRVEITASYAVAGNVFTDCRECPEMVVVPAGNFIMGSPEAEAGRRSDEGPQHEVTIARPFAVGRFEVTRGQFRRFVKTSKLKDSGGCYALDGKEWKLNRTRGWEDPGFAQTDEHPVVCVSHEDAQQYVRWLSQQTRQAYRLLAEAEWEYAARAGTSTLRYWGASDQEACAYANVADRTAQTKYGWKDETIFDCTDGYAETAPAGRFRPNKFGLYDMLGNAWEWTEDCDHDSYRGAPADGSAWIDKACGSRVIRGGGFFNEPQDLRSARRFRDPPDDRYFYLGFRVARTLAP